MPIFSNCCPPNRIGLPDIRPCSFAKAMTEPEKVIAPMMVPSPISSKLPNGMLPSVPMLKLAGENSAELATNTAAIPTSE